MGEAAKIKTMINWRNVKCGEWIACEEDEWWSSKYRKFFRSDWFFYVAPFIFECILVAVGAVAPLYRRSDEHNTLCRELSGG